MRRWKNDGRKICGIRVTKVEMIEAVGTWELSVAVQLSQATAVIRQVIQLYFRLYPTEIL